MQLGFVSAILPDASLEEVFSTAAELGYDCVELMCWPEGGADRRYAGVRHVEVESLAARDAARINELAASAGVSISGLGYYPNPLAADAEQSRRAIEHLQRVIIAADTLGVGLVNTFAGRDPARTIDENWPRFLEVWRPLVALAESRSVRIGIENCPMLFTGDEWPGGKNLAISPAVWERMFTDVPSAIFGLNYDPSHLVWQQMDYLRPLRSFADRIFHVHAKDVRVDRERLDRVGILAAPLAYHSPKLPGLGDIDWDLFFDVLREIDYRGPICVEVEDREFEASSADRIEALRRSGTYLRQFVLAAEQP